MVQQRQENSEHEAREAVPNLVPVAVDDQQRGIVGGLPTLQLLNVLPQLILDGLALVQHLRQLPVLALQGADVQLLLGTARGTGARSQEGPALSSRLSSHSSPGDTLASR